MALIKLSFQPGIDRDQTDYANEGGWYDADKVRFHKGYPEKIGGWNKRSAGSIAGYVRQLWNWVTAFGDNLLGAGSNTKVYLESNSNLFNITPLRDVDPTLTTTDTDNCLYTNVNSTTVTVVIGTTHDAATGDYVQIGGATGTVGGIDLAEINANHDITVVNTTAFTFTADTAATGTNAGVGGTAITIDFELSPGNAINNVGYGWGLDGWNEGGWGESSITGLDNPQRDWWFDNLGDDLFMNIREGAPFIWERGATADPTTALNTRAIWLKDYATNEGHTAAYVPVKVGQLLVSQRDKHLIAFGAVPYGSVSEADYDPLLIRWAHQSTPGNWEQTPTTSAGDIVVSRGSEIVRAVPTRQEILVFTDSSLYALQFTGTTDVFAVQEYSTNLSVMGPRAISYGNEATYWMGKDKFYLYDGRVQTLPSTLRDHVFTDFNAEQADQVVSGSNEQWDEIWWFYPSSMSNYNDRYVVYNYSDNLWVSGTLGRTAWLDTSQRAYPHAANTPTGETAAYLYEHESGLDDDGAALASYIQSNVFDLEDGDKFMLTRRLIPDITFNGSTAANPSVDLQLRHTNWPGVSLTDDAQDQATVTATTANVYTNQLFLRARARQMAFRLESSALGVHWRLGSPRLDVRPSGRK